MTAHLGLGVAANAESGGEITPIYFAFAASDHIDAAVPVANLMLGELVAAVTGDLLLTRVVRLCVVVLDHDMRVQLALTDLDATMTVPQLDAAGSAGPDEAVLESLRGVIEADYEQIRADGLPVQRPMLIVVSGGLGGVEQSALVDALHSPARSIVINDTSVWPPQLVVFGTGSCDVGQMNALAAGEQDVAVLAPAADDIGAAGDVLRNVLVERLRTGADPLLARWAVRLGELDSATSAGDQSTFERYPAPIQWGDGIRAHLRALALQETNLPAALLQRGVESDWPLKLVLSDDDIGCVEGALRRGTSVGTAFEGQPTLSEIAALPDSSIAWYADPALDESENAAFSRIRLCRSLADAVELLHQQGMTVGAESLSTMRVDPWNMTVCLDRFDSAVLAPPSDNDCLDRQRQELRWLAGTIAALLGGGHSGNAPLLDARGWQLLDRSNAAHPGDQVTSADWNIFLEGLIRRLAGVPRLSHADVAPNVVPLGANVTISWRSRFADAISIHMPGGRVHSVPQAELEEGHLALPVTVAGAPQILLVNSVGQTWFDLPYVYAFDATGLIPPSSDFDDLLRSTGLSIAQITPTLASWVAPSMPPTPTISSAQLSHELQTAIQELTSVGDVLRDLVTSAAAPSRQPATSFGGPNPFDPARWFSRPAKPTVSKRRPRFWKA